MHPPRHRIFRLLRALVLLALVVAGLTMAGIGLLSWGFYHAGQDHLREMKTEQRQAGLPQTADTAQRPAGPSPTP